MANWAWYGRMMEGAYGGGEFLSVHEYTHVQRWVDLIGSRPAVKRGQRVNSTMGPEALRMPERYAAVGNEQVRRVSERMFAPSARSIVALVPEGVAHG